MRYTEPDEPRPQMDLAETAEERLRKENEALRRELQELRSSAQVASHAGPPHSLWHPSALTIWAICLAAIVLMLIAFFAGYIPMQKRKALLANEALEHQQALPRVEVIEVARSSRESELQLPGNIQAITEAPLLARADGYIARRMVDIGDRVRAGQPVAKIDVPEREEQVRQSKAGVLQAHAALDQAMANLQQGKSEMELARVTARRWTNLVARGAVSRQENDQYQAQYQSKAANVQALEKAIVVQRNSVAAAEANV